jgi:tetratricopeptide (TPR) repeat protein
MLFGKSYEWQKIRFWILSILTITALIWFWAIMRQQRPPIVYSLRVITNLGGLMISGPSANDDPLENNIRKLKSLLGTDANTVAELNEVLNTLESNPQPDGAELLAKDIPDTAPPFYLAIKAVALRDFTKAKEYMRQAEIRDNTIKMLEVMGNFALESKRYFTATTRLQKAFELAPKDLQVIRLLAIALYNVPNEADREDFYKTAIYMLIDKMRERAPRVGAFAFNLALIQQAQGRFDEAEALFWFALRIFDATLGEHRQHIMQTYYSLKKLYEAVGKDEELAFLEIYMESKTR